MLDQVLQTAYFFFFFKTARKLLTNTHVTIKVIFICMYEWSNMYMHYSLCCMDYYKYAYEITIKVLCMCIRMYTNMNECLTVKLYVTAYTLPTSPSTVE